MARAVRRAGHLRQAIAVRRDRLRVGRELDLELRLLRGHRAGTEQSVRATACVWISRSCARVPRRRLDGRRPVVLAIPPGSFDLVLLILAGRTPLAYGDIYFVTEKYGTSVAVSQTLALPHAHPLPSASAHAAAPRGRIPRALRVQLRRLRVAPLGARPKSLPAARARPPPTTSPIPPRRRSGRLRRRLRSQSKRVAPVEVRAGARGGGHSSFRARVARSRIRIRIRRRSRRRRRI